ncbi:MAG: FtsX-like permease family protein [Eubacteriales bacterium]|nr:FtsX-like permease family protein [Eubacteriales bacterium]
MKKKALRKDFIMEIKKNPGRFLSMLFIVALGVAFFSGIRASEPDMRVTGDAYFDAAHLMDLKALSTYGVTEDDVAAFEELEGISQAEGAYSADFLHIKEKEQKVLHVMSIPKSINKISVSQGRMPEKEGECLVDDESAYEVGDRIALSPGTKDPVSDTLRTDVFTVVGRGNSPCYLSYGRGSASIGTGSIDAFLMVPEESFVLETYTEVYLLAEGAEELTAFTADYENKIEKMLDAVEILAEERGILRKEEILEEAGEKLAEAEQELAKGKRKAEKKLARARKKINKAEKQLEKGKKEIADGKNKIKEGKETLKEKQKTLDDSKKKWEEGKNALKEGWKKYKKGRKKFKKQKKTASREIQEGKGQLVQLKAQIAVDKADLARLEEAIGNLEQTMAGAGEDQKMVFSSQLNAMHVQKKGLQYKISEEEKACRKAQKQLNSAEKKLAKGEETLRSAKQELEKQEKTLAKGKKQLQDGQEQIKTAKQELKRQEERLLDGEKEIEKNERKLADARKKYKKGKREAKEEIADGEAKIEDARREIDELEDPKWYVYDRNTLVEYNGFGENAERIGAIGKVFPVLFFLVAALISLTSMTRMVEEQRTSIGTLKALGYGKFDIAFKYLGYALLATVGGSVLGVLAGEKILPYIIVYAYGILYRHLPKILVPYHWGYGLMASFFAIVCTLGATLFSCYQELSGQPSVLMRPPAPKNGRRVFLERVGVLWRHLNFTWKSTIRNLMRYKKRFFMTIFGIGGCMALMIVGFGLKDSCYEIVDLQYADIQRYDASIYLEEEMTPEQRSALQNLLAGSREVKRYTDANMQSITLVSGKQEREVYECVFRDTDVAAQFVDFHDRRTKQKYTLSDEGAIISEKTAKLLHVKEGDTVYIKDEDVGNRPVVISNICENYLGHYMYVTPSYFEKLHGEPPEYNSLFITVAEDCGREELEATGENILRQEGVFNVSYMHDIEKQLDDMLGSLNLVIIVLIISAGMLAFVVLYNLNTVNIAERKRELATLKVLGFYDKEVAQYVYRENILLTLLGAMAGCGLGKVLHRFIIETVEVDSAMFGRSIHVTSFVYSLLFTLAFSVIVNGMMYFKLKRIDMVESLKSIE